MYARSRGALFVLAVVVLLPGCYGKKTLRQPITVEEIAADVADIRRGQDDVREDVKALQAKIESQGETIRTLQAENHYLYDELETKLASIDAKLQEVINRETGFRDASPYWSGSAPQSEERSDWTAAAQEGEARVAPQDVATPAAPAEPLPGRELVAETSADADGQSKRVYDQAYLDLTRGNYSLAILGFKEFLRRLPASDLSDNAQYWIGESYYMQGDYRQAVREYGKVLDGHAPGDRVASALYKLGLAYLQLGDRTAAVDRLRQVYERYPDSEESRLARDKLDSLN